MSGLLLEKDAMLRRDGRESQPLPTTRDGDTRSRKVSGGISSQKHVRIRALALRARAAKYISRNPRKDGGGCLAPRVRDIVELRNRVRESGIPLVGESDAFVALLAAVERVARRSSATVLVRGETGTGKELIARAVHYLGDRRAFPFVPVNCGALPESLAENELFGHRPGAFTGASHDSMGLVRLAHKGTLFLDEVDSLPAKAQVALLRFLQDGTFRPLGAAREEQAEVRVVAASNRCLETEMRAGRFREDLYFRLNLISLDVPPLRARRGDAQLLATHFLTVCSQRYRDRSRRLHPATLEWFDNYRWPGNVRELENLVHREYLLCDDDEMQIGAPAAMAAVAGPPAVDDTLAHLSYRAAKSRALQDFDRAYLTQMVKRAQGNVTRAAALAGKERRAFGKLLKRYRIARGPDEDTTVN
jgi:DNA-binding NtrC family response regulator